MLGWGRGGQCVWGGTHSALITGVFFVQGAEGWLAPVCVEDIYALHFKLVTLVCVRERQTDRWTEMEREEGLKFWLGFWLSETILWISLGCTQWGALI